MNLYEIDTKLLDLINKGFTEDCVDFETGEINEDKLQEYLANLPGERDAKIEAYGLYVKNIMAEVEAIEKEEKALKKRREAKEKYIDRLSLAITNSLNLFGQSKFETSRISLSFRTSEQVVVEEGLLPKKYMVKKVEIRPDKIRIKEDLKLGKKIKGAEIKKNQNLQIK